MLAVQADGHEVTTVEGLAGASELHPIQEGFKDEHGLQCGFCTPGMMLDRQGAARREPRPDRGRGPLGAVGQPVPLHRLPEHREVGAVGRQEDARRRPTEDGADAVTQALDEIKIGGLGASRKRVEDNRFIRGKGNYVDDIVLPGMLHMEILRSPLAHARIRSIDTSKAWDDPRRPPRADRRDDGDPQPGLDADAVLRHAGRAGHRQGALPGPGGRLRHRRRPLHRQGRVRGDRRRLRAAAGDRQPDAGDGRGRAADPRRQGEPARQRRLRLGGRRQGRHRPRLRAGRPRLEARAALPALAPLAARVLRVDRRLQPRDVQAHRLHDLAGAAHHPGRGGAGRRAARAHDPDRLARPRRRLRQQGAGLPRLRHVDPGVDPARAAGEVDRGPHRQPDLDRVRPRRLPQGRAGAAQGRQDPRRPDAHRRRPRRVLLRRPAEQVQDRPDALGVRLLRHPGRAPHRPRHVHQQGARRRRLPLLVPGHRGDVLPGADGAGGRRRPRHGPGRVPADRTSSATTTSRTARRSASSPTPASTASASTSASTRSATRTSSSRRRRRPSAAGCSASASRR